MKLNKTLLVLRLQDAIGCSDAKAHKIVDQYILLCAKQILQHLNKSTDNNVYVSLTDLQNTLGDIVVKGKRYYVWNELQKFKERIIAPITVGSNLTEKLTMATVNYDLEDIILASGNGQDLVEHLYKPFEGEQLEPEMVPIDIFSLESFIKGNQAIDRTDPKNKNKVERIDLYLKHAQRILLIAKTFNGFMPHIPNESDFGRRYYKGPNLQNTPKVVRHAALGTCNEYDIESSVFAWKLSWFRSICSDQGFGMISRPATLEYLDHKAAIRRQVAEAVFGSTQEGYVGYIKEAITALGFGAPARVSGYISQGKYEPSALSTIIKSPEKLKTFLETAWVAEFVEEQRTMNAIIIEFCKEQRVVDELKTVPELLDKAGRIRPNSVISYLYQTSERQILKWIIEQAESSEVLLSVHDCVYTRRPVNLKEIRAGIREFGEFYNISQEQHQAFAYDDYQQEHLQRIQQEENAAAAKHKLTPRNVYNSDSLAIYTTNTSDSSCVDSGCDLGDMSGKRYNQDWDPYYQSMTAQEQREYQRTRQRALGNTLPDWVRNHIND